MGDTGLLVGIATFNRSRWWSQDMHGVLVGEKNKTLAIMRRDSTFYIFDFRAWHTEVLEPGVPELDIILPLLACMCQSWSSGMEFWMLLLVICVLNRKRLLCCK